MEEIRTRFKDKVLVDYLYQTPVDEFQARARRRRIIVLIIVAIALFVIWFVRR